MLDTAAAGDVASVDMLEAAATAAGTADVDATREGKQDALVATAAVAADTVACEDMPEAAATPEQQTCSVAAAQSPAAAAASSQDNSLPSGQQYHWASGAVSAAAAAAAASQAGISQQGSARSSSQQPSQLTPEAVAATGCNAQQHYNTSDAVADDEEMQDVVAATPESVAAGSLADLPHQVYSAGPSPAVGNAVHQHPAGSSAAAAQELDAPVAVVPVAIQVGSQQGVWAGEQQDCPQTSAGGAAADVDMGPLLDAVPAAAAAAAAAQPNAVRVVKQPGGEAASAGSHEVQAVACAAAAAVAAAAEGAATPGPVGTQPTPATDVSSPSEETASQQQGMHACAVAAAAPEPLVSAEEEQYAAALSPGTQAGFGTQQQQLDMWATQLDLFVPGRCHAAASAAAAAAGAEAAAGCSGSMQLASPGEAVGLVGATGAHSKAAAAEMELCVHDDEGQRNGEAQQQQQGSLKGGTGVHDECDADAGGVAKRQGELGGQVLAAQRL
jgi:hypothetical protein